ncbi:LysM peptidoglycan-binding domain-containing protein [Paraglaciecola arctica]|uniref:LysM peptidoglycan-binding domain-containing protein n=1 Tax=Paraglaciecola arctica TaxID=1128911 RepID=UPI0020906E79|nr:LysM peptidoglycan-binding domain-containing protein [Paraglaciecola arctica]
MIGNITKADERFQSIQTPELVPGAMLVLAQLRALKGDNLGAQQAFMLALDNQQFSDLPFYPKLLDYFCHQKKWQLLESYGSGLLKSSNNLSTKNTQLSMIGQCFFREQKWDKAKYWLNQLDLMQTVDPIDFLALARLSIEDKQFNTAKQFINRFEETKTKVDAPALWTTLEVYQGLQELKRAEQIGQSLSVLFPDSDYSRIYRQMRRLKVQIVNNNEKAAPTIQTELETEHLIHIMKKGETLYQLSKLYGISIPELQAWNPDLAINNISVGTEIRISHSQ